MIEAQQIAKIDEFLANKPYYSELEYSIPSGYKEIKGAVWFI